MHLSFVRIFVTLSYLFVRIIVVNLDKDAVTKSIFEQDHDISRIIRALSAHTGVDIVPISFHGVQRGIHRMLCQWAVSSPPNTYFLPFIEWIRMWDWFRRSDRETRHSHWSKGRGKCQTDLQTTLKQHRASKKYALRTQLTWTPAAIDLKLGKFWSWGKYCVSVKPETDSSRSAKTPFKFTLADNVPQNAYIDTSLPRWN